MRTYDLRPTPAGHELRRRPWYHDIRQDLAEAREHATGGVFRASAPPPDLVDYTAGLPVIRNQFQLGLCYGFAARVNRMLAHWLATGIIMAPDISPGFLAWNGRKVEGMGAVADVNGGCTIGDTLQGEEEAGVCAETLYPYDPNNPAAEVAAPSPAAVADGLTRRVDLQAVQVDFSKFANIHQVLADRHPIIFGFDVPASFEACPPTGELPLDPGPGSEGGHAGAFCASRLSTSTLREVNSWGPEWGLNGTCYFTYRWTELVWEMWAVVPVL